MVNGEALLLLISRQGVDVDQFCHSLLVQKPIPTKT